MLRKHDYSTIDSTKDAVKPKKPEKEETTTKKKDDEERKNEYM